MLIRNLIYILQIELYDARGFLKFSYTHLSWWKLEKRARIVWTKKAGLIYALTLFLMLIALGSVVSFLGIFGVIFLLPIALLSPLFIVLAVIIVAPVDIFLKRKLIIQTKKFLRSEAGNLIVIGITGSYGKTSTRDILTAILGEKYRVISLPENINTDVGIADYILKNKQKFIESEVFIVEMGAYRRGEIKKICDFVYPDLSILTGINESHLERFKSLENIIKTKFELPEATKKISVLNLDDGNIKNNYQNFKIANPITVTGQEATEVKILENFQGIEFSVEGQTFKTKLLATHNLALVMMSIKIARELGMAMEKISQGVEKVGYTPHRLEPIYNDKTDVWVIDDSYNGNYNGILSGLEVLGRAKGRKIVLTPGLVELGEKTSEIHREIGRLYGERHIDLVMLIKTKATKYLVEGMKSLGFTSYEIYGSTKEAHDSLASVIKGATRSSFKMTCRTIIFNRLRYLYENRSIFRRQESGARRIDHNRRAGDL